MRTTTSQNIVLFIVLCTILILLLVIFIAWIIYRYQQKQNSYFKNIEEIKAAHENTLLQSQIEMQENTFQNISKEIHDNIGQKLALAKLLLNTLPYNHAEKVPAQVDASVGILGQVVSELSALSRSMSNEIVLENGIIKAIEAELVQLKKAGAYDVNFEITGDTIFLDVNRELVLFRVIQEGIHNIIKHAEASVINISMQYNENSLTLVIADNGKGFQVKQANNLGTGIKNIKKRIQLLNGTCLINSVHNNGTTIHIEIPYV